jgi:hypothetical protein
MIPQVLDPPLHPPAPPPPPRRLSTDLRDLLAEAAGRSLTIGELEEILQGRGFALFILLFSLPFCAPVAIPMLSIPFGVVIMFLGLRITFGRKPSLPKFILSKRIEFSVLERIIRVGLKLCKWMEKVAKPRMHFLQRWPGMINLIGLGIASGGAQLLLPLPPLIPLSNTLPALSVVLLTAGLIERDGVFVLSGYVLNIAAWIYFGIMFAVVSDGARHLYHWFGG